MLALEDVDTDPQNPFDGLDTHAKSSEKTSLDAAEEGRFRAWVKQNKIADMDAPESHYDYRGYWKATGGPAVRFGVDHFPDTYKQHGHPTFSVESQYSNGPNDGGHWSKDTFIPAQNPFDNLDTIPRHDSAGILARNEAGKARDIIAGLPIAAARDASAIPNSPQPYHKKPGFLGGMIQDAANNPVGTALSLSPPGMLLGAAHMVKRTGDLFGQAAAETSLRNDPKALAAAENDPERVGTGEALGMAAMLAAPMAGHAAFSSAKNAVTALHDGMMGSDAPFPSDPKIGPFESPTVKRTNAIMQMIADRAKAKKDNRQQVMQSIFGSVGDDGVQTSGDVVRIPNDVPAVEGLDPSRRAVPPNRAKAAPEGLETDPGADLGAAGDATGKRKLTPVPIVGPDAPLQDAADLSAAVTPDPELVGKIEAMRPKRRADSAGVPSSRQGARIEGDAQPDIPEDGAIPAIRTLDGTLYADPGLALHAQIPERRAAARTASEREPTPDLKGEPFSMGGALTDNRIPGAGELPKVAKGSDTPIGLTGNLPEGVTPESVAAAKAIKANKFRSHSLEALSDAALDAHAELEVAQKAQQDGTYNTARWATDGSDASAESFEINRGEPRDHALAFEDATKTHDAAVAKAKQKLTDIERAFAMKGVTGDQLAEHIQGAHERRMEREGIQQEANFTERTSGDDPFAELAKEVPREVTLSGEPGARGLDPLEGTGATRVRGVSSSIAAKAVTEGLRTELGELPKYRQLDFADQGAKASELLAADPELARAIARGDENAPEGLLPNAVAIAVENDAIARGDGALLDEIASGRRAAINTTMGQDIGILRTRNAESPVEAIEAIKAAREAANPRAVKQVGVEVGAVESGLRKMGIPEQDVASFVDFFRCL